MAVKYTIEFDTLKGSDVKVELNYTSFVGSTTYVKGYEFILDWPDADLSKVADIKRSDLKFKLLNTEVSPDEFFSIGETDIKVTVYLNNQINWVGWLDTAPPSYALADRVFLYELVAKDGLHLLENATFTDTTVGTDLAFYTRRISQIIADCLAKTQLGLNFWSWINIYPDGSSVRNAIADPTGTRDPLYNAFLNQLTFQNAPAEFDSPILILQKITNAFKATIFQARGEWHFVYIEDWIRGNGLYGTQFDSDGVPLDISLADQKRVSVGLYENSKFINDDALISLQRKAKHVRLNFKYDLPPSVIRNSDLNSGDLFDSSALQKYARYDLDGWSMTGGTVYIYAELNDGDDAGSEKRRLMQFYDDTVNTLTTVTSNAITVQQGDKFSIRLRCGDARGLLNGQLWMRLKVTEYTFPFQVRYLKPDGKWASTDTSIPLLGDNTSGLYYDLDNPRESFYETVDPIPLENCYLEVQFYQLLFGNELTISRQAAIYDIDFQYTNYISNGKQAKGHYFQSGSEFSLKPEVEDEVFICDNLNVALKGVIVDSNILPLTYWFRNGVTEKIRFGKMITRAYWKMFYRNYYRIEADLFGLTDGNYFISPLNTIMPDAFTDREFIVSSLRIDLRNEKAQGTFVELSNTANTDDYDEIAASELFRYINVSNVETFQEPEKRTPMPWWFGAVGITVWLIKNNKKKKGK